MFCAAVSQRLFPGLTCLLRNNISIWSAAAFQPHGPRVYCICVCVYVRTSFGVQLGRLDWKVGTHFWVFGQRSGPRVDDPAFCASKKTQQDHHRFLNYTGPRCEVTLLQRSPTFIYRFIGLGLGVRPGISSDVRTTLYASPLNAIGRIDNRSVGGCGRETG